MFKPKFTNTADLGKAIDSIARRGAKLDADIQDAAMACLWRIQEHGDVGYLCRLFNSMPRGSRRNALAEWAAKYGKVQINTDKTTNKEQPFLFWKEGNTDYDGAMAEPWYECRKEKPIEEAFDFASQLQRLLQKAQKAQDAGKTVKGLDMLKKVMEAAGTVSEA